MLHLREEGLGGVGAAHIQLASDPLEERWQVVAHGVA
jgi:hypothetical protein